MARSLADHRAAALALLTQMPVLDVLVGDAVGAMLADDLVSEAAMPAMDVAACDGYAVAATDTAGASHGAPVTLAVSHDVGFDVRSRRRHVVGTTARVASGVPMPDGADAVIPTGDTDGGVARVTLTRAVTAGEHVRLAGADARAGEVMVPAGTRIGPRQLAVAAAMGRSRLSVRPVPRVVVVAVGSELVEPGTSRPGGGVPESNAYMLAASIRAAGAQAYRVGVVPDDRFALAEAIADQLVRADVVITTGALSGGLDDTLPDVLRQYGDVDIVDLAMRPGQHHGIGALATGPTDREIPVFALPGTPMAAAAAFETYVRPALRAMSGHNDHGRRRVSARVSQGWEGGAGVARWVPLTLTEGLHGGYSAAPCGPDDGWALTALAQANGYVVMEPGSDDAAPGDLVSCAMWDA